MKLLMITRKVDSNDALAGFTYNWVKEIGSHLEKLLVITWQKSDRGDLPDNIEIISLPENKMSKIFYLWFGLFKILPKINGVFCHMNPEYTILSAPLSKIFGKKTVSWYAHGSINWKTKLLLKMADLIITSSDSGFRINTPKKRVLQQGIDTDIFCPPIAGHALGQKMEIITVGRISPTKDYESMIKAIYELQNKNIRLKIIGDVILKEQAAYLESLKKMTSAMNLGDQVDFRGWVANKDMPAFYQSADLFINMSSTGSLDKVVLEAMACGCLVLTSNEAYKEILPQELLVEKDNYKALAEKIKMIMAMPETEKEEWRKKFRIEVVKNHNLSGLAKKIINQF